MGIGAHASLTLRRQFSQFWFQTALFIEEFLGPIAPQPIFEQLEVLGIGGRIGERHLVRTESALNLKAVDDFRARPALGRIEDDHRPARTLKLPVNTGVLLY